MDLNSASRRKNATRENTNTLKAWLYEHRKNPYPTKGEKIMLAIITKMTLTQVSTWFANARRRLKKENKMTWSPKNKGDDDDDDDDDKNENGHHQTGSDGEMRENDRDTDSVGGMAVDSDDEIIDAGENIWFVYICKHRLNVVCFLPNLTSGPPTANCMLGIVPNIRSCQLAHISRKSSLALVIKWTLRAGKVHSKGL